MRSPINLIALGILLALTACLPKVEVPPVSGCEIPALRERKNLPGVRWLPDEQCPTAYKCIDEEQYKILKDLVATLRSYENYLKESYQNVKERCGE